MRRFDLLIQTVVFLVALVMAFIGLTDRSALLYVLLAQLFIGSWQYVGGIIWLIAYPKFKARRIHLFAATAYLVILFAGMVYFDGVDNSRRNWFYIVYVFTMPWLLAIYYYAVTWRSVFPRSSKSGNFLPHISF